MHVTVDQTRRNRAAMSINNHPSIANIAVSPRPKRNDPPALHNNRIGIQHRRLQRPGKHQPDIRDNKLPDLLLRPRGKRHYKLPSTKRAK
jgi:hypothetical protein